jgi:hypothetical protein
VAIDQYSILIPFCYLKIALVGYSEGEVVLHELPEKHAVMSIFLYFLPLPLHFFT